MLKGVDSGKGKGHAVSIWEVIQVKGKDRMMKMMSMDKGGAGAEAEASNVTHQILHPKRRKTGATHKRKELNQWKVHRIQAVLNLYYECLDLYKNPHTANASWCAAKFRIPPSTFSHHFSDTPSSR